MPGPNWTYNEFQHIGVDFADIEQVRMYDVQQHTREEHERQLVQHLKILPGHTVLEYGAGTGAFTRAAAEVGAHVTSIDISPAMLEYSRGKATDVQRSSIDYVHSGFLSYEHPGPPVDFIVSKFAFHHLPDFWKSVALDRMHRFLKHDGRLYLQDVVFAFDSREYEYHITQWIDAQTSDAQASFGRADFEMHVRDEYSTFGWILEGMLQRAGFSIETVDYGGMTYAEYLCVRVEGRSVDTR